MTSASACRHTVRVPVPRLLLAIVLAAGVAQPAFSQSQAINGVVEGTVTDSSGAVLPGVTLTVRNTDTGAERVVTSNARGLYRAQLLPLGTYRVTAELSGFKKFEQTGILLSAGETVVVNVSLGVGAVTEVVSVSADSGIVNAGKIEQGRTLTSAEIHGLPMPSRNPYNFALLQPGVTGFENAEFGVPRLTSNGALLRVNYQVDGSNNTEKDRAGIRQMPMSEVMIREVKIVTTGYSPEFGQSMGLIYNAITPSGTNSVKGQASYGFQRRSFAAFPFFTSNRTTKPPTEVNVLTMDVGGPVVRDRTHFFGGYEHAERDLSGTRVITISAANAAALGLSEPAYMPAALNTEFAIGKIDHQISLANRLSVRYMFFDNFIVNNVGGGLTSVQRATDFTDRQHSTGAQLVSTIGTTGLNEVRVQYATRAQSRAPGSQAGSGPAINISGVANFGGPIGASADAGFGFTEDVLQVNDSFTFLRADHAYKFGLDVQHVRDTRTQTISQAYTFSSVANYLSARNGANPLAYSTFTQYFGEPDLEYASNLYGVFVQDDWRLSPTLKLLYGVRYDLYDVPKADPNAPVQSSRDYAVDKNNWGPRVGLAWTLGASRRAVLRMNSGLMYDQALLATYEQALVNDGTNRRASASFQPATAGAPAFPNVLSAGSGAQPNLAWTVDPGFRVARTWQNNVQFERGLSDAYSVSVGGSYVRGNALPVVTNINPINPTGTLPDGRPIFSTAISAATRLDPRYNVIQMVQSIGESTYKNLTLQLTRRQKNGIQFDFAYTLAKGEDTAPIVSQLSVQGDAGRSDQTSLERDRGPNILDQRHTFTGSIVAEPHLSIRSKALAALLNNNQFGIVMLFANGIPVNLRSNLELNNDGVASDRPSDVPRNSLSLPARYNVDMRYSRQVPIGGRVKAGLTVGVVNLFNTVQWAGVNATLTTNAQGVPTAALPTSSKSLPATAGYGQRQFELGFKVTF